MIKEYNIFNTFEKDLPTSKTQLSIIKITKHNGHWSINPPPQKKKTSPPKISKVFIDHPLSPFLN